MYKFGKKSLIQLKTCHKDIQIILNEIIKFYDFSVLEGIRTTERQQSLFADGRSKLDGINKLSKHQGKEDENGNMVSFAVDVMPYKKGTNAFEVHEKERARFYMLMGMVKATTKRLIEEEKISHDVRFGLDWDGDDTFRDNGFDDLPHAELIKINTL